MFNLDYFQRFYFVNPNSTEQSQNEFDYTIENNYDVEFNISPNLPCCSWQKESKPDEDTYKLSRINIVENLNPHNVSDGRYDASSTFTPSRTYTTLDCIPTNINNNNNYTSNSNEENKQSSTYWPIINSLNTDRSLLENYSVQPRSDFFPITYPYALNAFDINNNPQVMSNNGLEYESSNAMGENDANFNIDARNMSLRNGFSELSVSQPMFDSKLDDYGKYDNSNEIGVCLRNLHNNYMDTFPEISTVYLNSHLHEENQQPDIDEREINDDFMGTEQIPVLETTKDPLNVSDQIKSIDFNDPSTRAKYYAHNFKKYETLEGHRTVPEGDDFVQMFQLVPTFRMCFLENKSIIPPTLDLGCIGFDEKTLIDRFQHSDTEEDRSETKETEGKILSMFPRHNRKYKRRY